MGFGFNNHNDSKIKSAAAPKVKKDFREDKPKNREHQKTIKTDASLVDELGALQMALGYKNRTETFRHLLKVGTKKLLENKPKHTKRFKEAYQLIHHS